MEEKDLGNTIKLEAKVIPSQSFQKMLQTLAANHLETHPLIKKALRAGAQYLVKQGKARLKAGLSPGIDHTGDLSRSMGVVVKKSSPGTLAGFRRGQTGNGKIYGGQLSWLIDRGTAERQTAKGYNRGMSGHGQNGDAASLYFWKKTRDEDTGEALQLIEDGIRMAFNDIMGAKSGR